MKINFIYRCRIPSNNSIEQIFDGITEKLDGRRIKIAKIELPISGATPSAIFRNLFFLLKLRDRESIYHITGDVHYAALATLGKTILTVHDIQSAIKGNSIRKMLIKMFWFWLPALFVNKITVISQFSKDELAKVIPFAKKKIVVIHNPVNKLICYSPKIFNETNPRILHLGTKPNKNLEGTIVALRDITCHLVIIGELSNEQEILLTQYNIEYTNRYHLLWMEVMEEYIKSDMVCFASLYEGFGMPIIEAQKTGRPVITSNISSMPEVAGNGASFVNPKESAEITSAIVRIIKDEDFRDDLIKQGLENVKRFEIDHIIQQYKRLYESS